MVENNYAHRLGGSAAYYVAFNGQDAPMFVTGGDAVLAENGILLDYQVLPVLDELKLSKTQNSLEVYLSTTNSCNLGCDGCAAAIDVRKNLPVIEPDLDAQKMLLGIEKIFESARNNGKTDIKFKFAGGEPTMPRAFRTVVEAHNKIQELNGQYPEIRVDEVVLTNGTFLNNSLVEKIKQMGMRLSISLWGRGEVNDEARGAVRTVDKYGFIVEGIRRVVEAGIDFNIHHVITPDNADSFPDFMTHVWDIESPDFIGANWGWPDGIKRPIPLGINIMRPQSDETLKNFNESGYQKIAAGFLKGLERINEVILRGVDVPIAALTGLDYLSVFEQRATTCGAGQSYIVMGSGGFTYCHEAMLEHDSNWDDGLKSDDLLTFVNLQSGFNTKNIYGANLDFGGSNLGNILSVIGGPGCPRTRRQEGNGVITNKPASISEKLYQIILPDLLKVIYNYFAMKNVKFV